MTLIDVERRALKGSPPKRPTSASDGKPTSSPRQVVEKQSGVHPPRLSTPPPRVFRQTQSEQPAKEPRAPRTSSTRMAGPNEMPKSASQPSSPSVPPRSASSPDSKRPNILVVERSLDEVILSYLQDDLSEK
jgi:hypothetical protein